MEITSGGFHNNSVPWMPWIIVRADQEKLVIKPRTLEIDAMVISVLSKINEKLPPQYNLCNRGIGTTKT